jgi:hypothetical protein
MKERKSDTYRVQAELMKTQLMQQLKYNNGKQFGAPPQYNKNAQQCATPSHYNNVQLQYNQRP